MKKRHVFFIIFFSLCALTTYAGGTSKTIDAPCLTNCARHYAACSQTCENNCRNCQIERKLKAEEHYQRYLHREKLAGGYDLRQLSSYKDPLHCRKVTCNCAADLNACKQACYGTIHKTLRTAPYCS